MDTKRMLIGTIVGAVVLAVVGWLIFGLAFADFYTANAGSATGVDRLPQLHWAVLLGSLAYAALIALGIGQRASPASPGTGAKIGAIVGFLLWFTADFTFYGITNMANLTRTIVDPLLELVHGGIAGAVIAFTLAKLGPSGR